MDTQTTVIDARQSRQALLAGSVGNFIEWYEFGVYGFLATVIAANFFTLQGESEFTSLILTYAAFALAFFCRPIGAVIFGRIGDRIGRRPTLIAVLLLMTVATALIGVMPTYASIGVAAPGAVRRRRVRRCGFADDRVRTEGKTWPVRGLAVADRGLRAVGRGRTGSAVGCAFNP